jgi:hypothetical protein
MMTMSFFSEWMIWIGVFPGSCFCEISSSMKRYAMRVSIMSVN